MEQLESIKISQKKFRSLVNNTAKSAEIVNLQYVNSDAPGIRRERNGKGFKYIFNGRTVTEKATLQRIQSLVIPPAWESVWICKDENGHLQATGIDIKQRKQYKYHPLWSSLRNQTKFFNLYEFGKALPDIRKKLKVDLSKPGLPQEKVLAAVISIMQCTCIRIGNSAYEKLYGSFGLTTLKDKHVIKEGNNIKFSFKGKKGIYHDISLKTKKLVNIVMQCRDIPGKELFQFYDEYNKRHSIDSGMVNNYIKNISGGHFTAKDFRTWAGSLHALSALREIGIGESKTDLKKNIVSVLDSVASHLGNTRTVCKKYYVHPALLELYENNTLNNYKLNNEPTNCGNDDINLNMDEQVLMKVLYTFGKEIRL